MISRATAWTVVGISAVAAAVGVGGLAWLARSATDVPTDSRASDQGADASRDVRDRSIAFCGGCHAYAPPDTLPKAFWPPTIRAMYDFYKRSDQKLNPPPFEKLLAFYQQEAPDRFPTLPRTPDATGLTISLERSDLAGPHPDDPTAISYVGLANLSEPKRPDVLACDMARGELLVRRADRPDGPMTVLARDLAHPAHVEVADLDADGFKDLLVADLGVPMPSDERLGRVLWLRGKPDGTYETKVLAGELGRVCDIQPADFDGDGDLDLIVAVFGWRRVGEILYLEQRKGPDGSPKFARRTIDARHGTIHVPVVDLNRDCRPDFVAIITQEHETVVAFLNAGGGNFQPRTLYAAPHPAYGSSGIAMADLDGDGDLDVVLTNGDVYDSPLLKPYHGVAWLENRGDDGPFERHAIGAMYGAHRALAADLDGDGDLDIVAASFLGEPFYGSLRREVGADALVIFEQTGRGKFARHAIERERCDYPTIALGDLDGDGKPDILTGRFRDFGFSGAAAPPLEPGGPNAPVAIWKNRGRK